jgi:hypothetical protein
MSWNPTEPGTLDFGAGPTLGDILQEAIDRRKKLLSFYKPWYDGRWLGYSTVRYGVPGSPSESDWIVPGTWDFRWEGTM